MSAAGGMLCPLCGKYASFTLRGRLYRHRGEVAQLISPGFMECRASGFTVDQATVMKANKDAGRHSFRNADGSWITRDPS